MSNNSSTALVPGSLGAIAQRDGLSVAESFLSCEVAVLVDVSGSMAMTDARGGQQRYVVACQELARLQADMPGKIGVIAFSDTVAFSPGGVPIFLGSGTDLAGALRFAKVLDGTVRFIVVSDGYPDDQDAALRIAYTFKSRIDCIYVGPETERGGAAFLARLASTGHGQHVTADRAAELAAKVQQLMLA